VHYHHRQPQNHRHHHHNEQQQQQQQQQQHHHHHHQAPDLPAIGNKAQWFFTFGQKPRSGVFQLVFQHLWHGSAMVTALPWSARLCHGQQYHFLWRCRHSSWARCRPCRMCQTTVCQAHMHAQAAPPSPKHLLFSTHACMSNCPPSPNLFVVPLRLPTDSTQYPYLQHGHSLLHSSHHKPALCLPVRCTPAVLPDDQLPLARGPKQEVGVEGGKHVGHLVLVQAVGVLDILGDIQRCPARGSRKRHRTATMERRAALPCGTLWCAIKEPRRLYASRTLSCKRYHHATVGYSPISHSLPG